MTTGVTAAFDELEKDEDLWVVVLTGAGDKAFCAGMDLKAFAAGEGRDRSARARGGFAGFARRTFPMPIIAAVNGPALAGGFEIVLSCDLVVAAEHAFFGIPEVKRGLLAAGGGLVRLPKRLPMAMAMELALTGDSITAARAYELGLVNRVVPADRRSWTRRWPWPSGSSTNAPLSVRYSRQLTFQSAEVSEAEAWDLSEEAATRVVFCSDRTPGRARSPSPRSGRPTGKGR